MRIKSIEGKHEETKVQVFFNKYKYVNLQVFFSLYVEQFEFV